MDMTVQRYCFPLSQTKSTTSASRIAANLHSTRREEFPTFTGLWCKRRVNHTGSNLCENEHPIVMTTIAMGAGMLPIALGWGADPSFRAPMPIVVIGGLIASTVLSLLLIPMVFIYDDDAAEWLAARVRGPKRTARAAPEALRP